MNNNNNISLLVNINEDSPRDITSFDEWATMCGVQRHTGYQLTADQQNDSYNNVYPITTEDIPTDSPVLFVPNEMIISSNIAKQELDSYQYYDFETIVHNNIQQNEIQYFYLMIKILMEYEKGIESPFFQYFNSLPRFFTNGASMTTLCLECLPPLTRAYTIKERHNVMVLCSNLKNVPFLSESTKNNDDLCKWAYQIAHTRSFEVPKNYYGAVDGSNNTTTNNDDGDVIIVPMADMFNHGGNDPEIILKYDEIGNCCAYTTKDVPAGSPLRISYGHTTNPSFLFAKYGFLDDTTRATFCKLIPAHIDTKLQDMGYSHSRMLFYKDTGEVSEEVFDVLLYQILGSNSARQQEFYRAHMDGDDESKHSFHQVYWPETSAKLLEHLDTFLIQLDELSAKTYESDINQHPRLPLIRQHNEFVKNTFLAVRNRYFS